MPNQMPGTGRLVYVEMAVPTAGLVIPPTWRGVAMRPLIVLPLLDGLVFEAGGPGRYSLESRVSGRRGSIEVQLTPVTLPALVATGSITTVVGSALVDTETFVLDDGANAPTTFEFDSGGGITPGNVAVAFTALDTADQVRDAIIAAINGVVAGLAITASPGGAGLVSLVNDAVGVAGNVAITDTVAAAGFVVSGMSGGRDAGPYKTLLYLTDNLVTPSNYLTLQLDPSNRPLVNATNNVGDTVALTTPTYGIIAPGSPVRVRWTWDSENLVDATRHMTLSVNGEATPSADWAPDPTLVWDYFQPTHLVVGASLGTSDFDGTIQGVQISNKVVL